LREALRKYSVVPTVTRTNSEEVECRGKVFPKGTTFMIGIQAVHQVRWGKGRRLERSDS